jgi:hypothetical protein
MFRAAVFAALISTPRAVGGARDAKLGRPFRADPCLADLGSLERRCDWAELLPTAQAKLPPLSA